MYSPEGEALCQWEARLCESEEDLRRYYGYRKDHTRYFARIPSGAIWPLAFLEDIAVNKQSRGRGIGSRALADFIQQARRLGAEIGLARVGWGAAHLADGGRVQNLRFYSKNGWHPLYKDLTHADASGHLDQPYIYHDLTLPTPRPPLP